jgi:hypothetical protein
LKLCQQLISTSSSQQALRRLSLPPSFVLLPLLRQWVPMMLIPMVQASVALQRASYQHHHAAASELLRALSAPEKRPHP